MSKKVRLSTVLVTQWGADYSPTLGNQTSPLAANRAYSLCAIRQKGKSGFCLEENLAVGEVMSELDYEPPAHSGTSVTLEPPNPPHSRLPVTSCYLWSPGAAA